MATLSVLYRHLPQVSTARGAPARVLDVVAVAVVGPVLAGLARDVDLDLAELAQLRASDVGQRKSEGDLVLAEVVPTKDPGVRQDT